MSQEPLALDTLRFLSEAQVREIADRFGTPAYVYSEKLLREAARSVMAFPNAFGLTARFAMKANPNRAVLQLFNQEGLQIDASSEYEAQRAIVAGIPATQVLITSQQYPQTLPDLLAQGCEFTATSLQQLQRYGEEFAGSKVTIRFNPGLGSGGTNRTNTGGPAASFGIWHEYVSEAVAIVERFRLRVNRVHTHIGSGSDPDVWQSIAAKSISLLTYFPSADTLSLGGGFKVARMPSETAADLQRIGSHVREEFVRFAEVQGRRIRLEVEPGTFLCANAGAILSRIESVKDTGKSGYRFYLLDCGLSEFARPAMFGAQHPLVVIPQNAASTTCGTSAVIVAGHCCESGDILTPAPGEPELLQPRLLRDADTGDFLVIEGAGAYTAGYCFKHYNSFPEVPEILVRENGELHCIRRRQSLEQMLENEQSLPSAVRA